MKDLTETIGVVDNRTNSVDYARNLTEAFSVSDARTIVRGRMQVLYEAISVSDGTITNNRTRGFFGDESINLVDVWSSVGGTPAATTPSSGWPWYHWITEPDNTFIVACFGLGTLAAGIAIRITWVNRDRVTDRVDLGSERFGNLDYGGLFGKLSDWSRRAADRIRSILDL